MHDTRDANVNQDSGYELPNFWNATYKKLKGAASFCQLGTKSLLVLLYPFSPLLSRIEASNQSVRGYKEL